MPKLKYSARGTYVMRALYAVVVVAAVFANTLACCSTLVECSSASMGPPDANYFLHESRGRDAIRDPITEPESSPDAVAYVPIVAVLVIVALLAYFTRRDSKT